MSKFWGFRSLWRTCWWWMYARPRKSWNMKSWKEWTPYLSRFEPLCVDFSSKSKPVIWKNIVKVSLKRPKKKKRKILHSDRKKKDKENQISRPCPKQRDSGFSWHLISLILKELPFLKNLQWNFEVSFGTLVIDLDVKDLIFSHQWTWHTRSKLTWKWYSKVYNCLSFPGSLI